MADCPLDVAWQVFDRLNGAENVFAHFCSVTGNPNQTVSHTRHTTHDSANSPLHRAKNAVSRVHHALHGIGHGVNRPHDEIHGLVDRVLDHGRAFLEEIDHLPETTKANVEVTKSEQAIPFAAVDIERHRLQLNAVLHQQWSLL